MPGATCHSGTEGMVGAALGAHSGTQSQKHGRGSWYQVGKQSLGSIMHSTGI